MLTLPEIFEKDIQGRNYNLHPIIVIYSDPVIYISQNHEIISVNGTPTTFKAMNLKVPSIKESIDLETRKLKINNVTVSLSNVDNFSDVFNQQSFIDKYVDVYWKSQTSNNLSDCLLVYKAVIKRIKHNDTSISLILEDKTENVVHKKIPIKTIERQNTYNDKYLNRIIPMVYGTVDKSPAVLWKTTSQNTPEYKYVYAITDRFDLTTVGQSDEYSGHNITSSNTSSTTTPLSIFTGTYCWIPNTYQSNDSGYTLGFGYPSTLQWNTYNNKVRLEQHFLNESPRNSIADNTAQVVINRAATSVSLQDFAHESEAGQNYNYLGQSDGYSIGSPDNVLNQYDINSYDSNTIDHWDVYSSVPNQEYDSYEADDDTQGGWIDLASFASSPSSYNSYLFYDTNGGWSDSYYDYVSNARGVDPSVTCFYFVGNIHYISTNIIIE